MAEINQAGDTPAADPDDATQKQSAQPDADAAGQSGAKPQDSVARKNSGHSDEQVPDNSKFLTDLKRKIEALPNGGIKGIDGVVRPSSFNISFDSSQANEGRYVEKDSVKTRPFPRLGGGGTMPLPDRDNLSEPGQQGAADEAMPQDSLPAPMTGGEQMEPGSEQPEDKGDESAESADGNKNQKSGDKDNSATDSAGGETPESPPGSRLANEAEQAAGGIDPKMIKELGSSATELITKGKRPPDEVIWSMADKLLMLVGVPPRTLSLVRIGIKLFGESDKEILLAIWPEKYPPGSDKDLDARLYLANPAKYIDKAKLQAIARRVMIKLGLIAALSQLLVWILVPAIFLTVTCVTIKYNTSWFDPAGAAAKVVGWASGLTDLCNKIMNGAGGGSQQVSGCSATAEADKPRFLVFIHIAHAQNATCYNGPIGTGIWKDKINQYSNRQDLGISLDPCILTAIVERESHGDPNIVGYDGGHHPDPVQGIGDQFDPNRPPKYNLNWNYSHGIGLTQWTIFPNGDRNGGTWPDANVPQRQAFGKWYTVQALLSPDTSLDLTSRQMASYLKSESNNLQQAFADYNGGLHTKKSNALNYGVLVIKLYNQCKLAGNGGV